ncbi:MAG: hypothetical protein ACLFT3_20215 [Cyclobacteriaceae bacterium]
MNQVIGEILEIIPGEKIKYSTFDPNLSLVDKPENYIHVSYLITADTEVTWLTKKKKAFS